MILSRSAYIQPDIKYEILLDITSSRYSLQKVMADRYRQFTLVLLTLGCLLVPMAAVKAEPNPPTDVSPTPIDLPGVCAFPVQLLLTGKGKQINLPGNRVIFTSPGLKVTVINLNNSKQTDFVITGALKNQVNPDGSVTTTATGRNLLSDPIAGFVVSSGVFNFTFDATGNLTQPLNGNGQLTEVCPIIQ